MNKSNRNSNERTLAEVRRIVQKYVGKRKGVLVFLFGSRAGKHFTSRSDFDIGILMVSPDGKPRHSYHEEVADEIYSKLKQYGTMMETVIKNLREGLKG